MNCCVSVCHMWARQVGSVKGNVGGGGGKQNVLAAGDNVKT